MDGRLKEGSVGFPAPMKRRDINTISISLCQIGTSRWQLSMIGQNMHAGKETIMKPGANWAFAFPASLGLVTLLLSQFAPIFKDLSYLSLFAGYFIFGSALSAWLATRRLKRIESLEKLKRWRTSFTAGLVAASSVHLVSTLLLLAFQLLLVYFLKNSDAGFGGIFNATYDADYILSMLVVLSSACLILWFIITLPLSLICATIFWRVTKFPEDVSVF